MTDQATNRAGELIDGAAARAIQCAQAPGIVLAQEQFRTDETLYSIEARDTHVQYSIKGVYNFGGIISRVQMVSFLAAEIRDGRKIRAGRY